MSSIDFTVIVPALQAGDKAAWDKLMVAFYAWSVTQAKSVVRDAEQAKDIAVEFWAWLRTDGVKGFDPAKGSFYNWMASQLRYRALDATKRQKPKVAYYSCVSDPNSFDPEAVDPDPVLQLSAMQDLNAIAAGLKPAQRDVFWLLLEGATVEDIAADCGVSEKRARNMIGEVREAIRAQRGTED